MGDCEHFLGSSCANVFSTHQKKQLHLKRAYNNGHQYCWWHCLIDLPRWWWQPSNEVNRHITWEHWPLIMLPAPVACWPKALKWRSASLIGALRLALSTGGNNFTFNTCIHQYLHSLSGPFFFRRENKAGNLLTAHKRALSVWNLSRVAVQRNRDWLDEGRMKCYLDLVFWVS